MRTCSLRLVHYLDVIITVILRPLAGSIYFLALIAAKNSRTLFMRLLWDQIRALSYNLITPDDGMSLPLILFMRVRNLTEAF